jgi:hypothetical protein
MPKINGTQERLEENRKQFTIYVQFLSSFTIGGLLWSWASFYEFGIHKCQIRTLPVIYKLSLESASV